MRATAIQKRDDKPVASNALPPAPAGADPSVDARTLH